MNEYRDMMIRHHNECSALPIGSAFTDAQFREMMAGWGLDPERDLDKIYKTSSVAGVFYQKKDNALIVGTLDRQQRELEAAIANDKTGDGFIFGMFRYELNNHEYGYTGDFEDTLDALGYTMDQVKKNPALLHGMQRAAKEIMEMED